MELAFLDMKTNLRELIILIGCTIFFYAGAQLLLPNLRYWILLGSIIIVCVLSYALYKDWQLQGSLKARKTTFIMGWGMFGGAILGGFVLTYAGDLTLTFTGMFIGCVIGAIVTIIAIIWV